VRYLKPEGQEFTSEELKKHATSTIIVMALMGTLITYVETMVTPAINILVHDFHTTYTQISWIITAYVISGTISAALFGRLADIVGRKKIFVSLSIVYAIAVSLGGFATNLGELVAIRALQGLGFGMFPVAFALLNDQVPKERLALAQGILSATFSAGAALGLVLGSWIIDNLDWEWSFHSAIPVAILLSILSWIVLRDSRSPAGEKIDYLGIAFLSYTVFSFILAVSEGQTWGWTSMTIIMLFVSSFFSLIYFLISERSLSDQPFINLDTLKIRNVLLANISGLFSLASLYFLFFTVPTLLQAPSPAGFGMTIFDSGLILLPAAVLSMLMAPVGAKITLVRGPKVSIIVGSFVLLIAYVFLLFLRTNILYIITGASILGAGLGMVFVGIINILLLSVSPEKAGEATGMNVVFRNVGTAIAPAVAGVFETIYFENVTVAYVPFRLGPLPEIPYYYSFPSSNAYTVIYGIGIVFIVMNLIVASMMKNIKVKKNEEIPD
jgi:EmrB/QacA subfamily drug resistance transporter